jgi:hypothetical protein
MAPARPDRYEPLPSLPELPRFIARKLSRNARRVTLVGLALVAVAIAIGVPTLIAAKHRSDAAAERASARAHAAAVAALRAELRLVNGHGTAARGLTGAAAIAAREALVRDLSAAVGRDAERRHRTGEFARQAKRVDCSRYPVTVGGKDPADDLALRQGRYGCLAVTTEFAPGAETTGGAIGYPYRARVDFESGRFTFCKISGRPGEGSLLRPVEVVVPVACGGTRG